MSSKTVDDFLDHVRKSAQDGTLVRLNLGASIQPDGIRNVFIRPVRLKDSSVLSFVYRHPTRDVTKNFSNDEAIDLLRDLLGQQFLNGFLSTTTGTAQLTWHGSWSRSSTEPYAAVSALVPSRTVRCEPAENPNAPIFSGSNPRFFASLRTRRTARCPSSHAL
jgi:hypothetical protein